MTEAHFSDTVKSFEVEATLTLNSSLSPALQDPASKEKLKTVIVNQVLFVI